MQLKRRNRKTEEAIKMIKLLSDSNNKLLSSNISLQRKVQDLNNKMSAEENKENSDPVLQHLLQPKCQNYNIDVKKFATTVHYYSPKAYEFLRNRFENKFPHPKSILRWYRSIDCKVGFTLEAFEATKLKSESVSHKLYFCLIFDEISIRQKLEIINGEIYGNAFNKKETASQILVFMLKPISALL